MSPRAASRLETAQHPRAGDTARRDVPTCRLTEKLGDVRSRVEAKGWNAAVVVDDERVVLGLLRSKELAMDAAQPIENVMRPGPSTFRPYVSLHEMLHFMVDHKLESSPVTTSDGRLVGLLLQKDVVAAMEKEK